MRVLILSTALAASLLGGQHDHDDPETFESILNLVIRSSRERLRPLKTFRIERQPANYYWYEVTDSLPGAQCRIYEHPRMVYLCTWTAAKPGGPSTQEALRDDVLKATGEQYSVVPTKAGLTFEPREPRRYPVIEVSGERKSKDGMQLRVYPVSRD